VQATSMGATSQDGQPLGTSMGRAMHDSPYHETTLLNGIFMTRNVTVLAVSPLASVESHPCE
jgi:hypothetical protein